MFFFDKRSVYLPWQIWFGVDLSGRLVIVSLESVRLLVFLLSGWLEFGVGASVDEWLAIYQQSERTVTQRVSKSEKLMPKQTAGKFHTLK